jgi:hypothetical protein
MSREAAAVPKSALIPQGKINVLLVSNKEPMARATVIKFSEKPALSRYTTRVGEYESTEACKIAKEIGGIQTSVAK